MVLPVHIMSSILIGHNSRTFDTPRLFFQMSQIEDMMEEVMGKPIYFGESLPLLRKEAWLPKSKSFGAVYQHITGKTFNAHDALADTLALQEILTDDRLENCLAATRKKCRSHSHRPPHAKRESCNFRKITDIQRQLGDC